MKARVRLIGQALEAYEKLKELAKKENEKGIASSENITLLRSINKRKYHFATLYKQEKISLCYAL